MGTDGHTANETPRTDALVDEQIARARQGAGSGSQDYEELEDFARQIERKLAEANAENAVLREQNFAMNATIASAASETAPTRSYADGLEDAVLQAVYDSFPPNSAGRKALLFTRWKDGIDIDVPTSEVMDFVKRLAENAAATLSPGLTPAASAPCVARRAVEEIKAIIQKHVPLPGWAYEDEIVRVVRECERRER